MIAYRSVRSGRAIDQDPAADIKGQSVDTRQARAAATKNHLETEVTRLVIGRQFVRFDDGQLDAAVTTDAEADGVTGIDRVVSCVRWRSVVVYGRTNASEQVQFAERDRHHGGTSQGFWRARADSAVAGYDVHAALNDGEVSSAHNEAKHIQ